ncbi:MAG: hypothetical protein HOF75_03560 [Flavobacteriaceae bacterium]|jgi:hypothetical protein|nr:hypothetical protein [Flavobacteriaceae bacterium]MBT3920685.1 hypothetical protein [Flavobacteriaceae bacterium]MBT6705825.1 hypothetical protein [Flavobacteriaceae bacterium]MBT7242585.1 hypothetical protein [Flavobacteriaceae bacterium]
MKYLITCVFMFWIVSLLSQNKEVLYGLEETPQAMLLNPGSRISYEYHFGVPLLSHIHVNGGSSGVSVYDIFQESSLDINTRISNKIFELENTDFFTATQQLEILNFGWKNKKNYYFSGGIYQEFDFILYFPKDLAILAWEGNANYIGKEFNLGEINVSGDLLTVYHFGVNKKINKKITVGVRAKLYSSMLSFSSTSNSGTFVTIPSESGDNIYDHIVSNATINVNTSGITSLSDLDTRTQVINKLLGRSFFGGNLGIGVDLGATYEINEKWTASASILDLGAIFHKKNIESYQVSGEYNLDGIELLFPPLGNGDSSLPYYEDLIDDIGAAFTIDTIYNSYIQMRPVKMYASVKYNFGQAIGGDKTCNCLKMGENQKYNQSIGFQYFSIIRPKGPQIAATLFYYHRLSDYFSVKATYTADSYSYSNVGLGLITNIKMVNFYIVADNLQWYSNLAKAKSVSLQFGFNIIIDKNE